MHMIEIKLIVTLLTLIIGAVYARKEIVALFRCINETHYVDLTYLRRKSLKKKMAI